MATEKTNDGPAGKKQEKAHGNCLNAERTVTKNEVKKGDEKRDEESLLQLSAPGYKDHEGNNPHRNKQGAQHRHEHFFAAKKGKEKKVGSKKASGDDQRGSDE
jgi:hypothetical protein